MPTEKIIHEENSKAPEIVLYGLSFCDHCRDAKEFLERSGIDFTFVQVDTLSKNEILMVKRKIEPENKKSILYPVLKIDSDFLYGFDQLLWEKKLVHQGHKLKVR